MAVISDFILRGTRAAQPTASAYNTGYVYYVTDELLLERSNGSAWQSITPAPGGVAWTLVGSQALSGANAYPFTGLGTPTDIMVVIRGVTFGSADSIVMTVSVDNGSNYLTSSGDYVSVAGSGGETNRSNLLFYDTAATAARSGGINICPCNLAGPKLARSNFFGTDGVQMRLIPTTSQINAIRIFSAAANNFTGGTAYIYKR